MNSNTPMAQSGRGKVAIPRMHRHTQPPTKDRRRVTRACTACRNHKIKCTGDTPRCKHCESTNRDCVYILPRKDRLKMLVQAPFQAHVFLLRDQYHRTMCADGCAVVCAERACRRGRGRKNWGAARCCAYLRLRPRQTLKSQH